jgi:glycosyltransferase involved in cell wall biosynthesis
MVMGRTLIIYNLETNLDSHVLASAHDWIHEFSFLYNQVYVFSTHVGRVNLPQNVSVIETGGGNFKARAIAIGRLLGSLRLILKNKKNIDAFHHMSSKTLLLLGIPIRMMKVPQIIWYSHSVADPAIKIGARFSNAVVSATMNSVPKLPGQNVRPIGHGISLKRLDNIQGPLESNRKGIVSVGRVVAIKRIEDAIYAISSLEVKLQERIGSLKLVGPNEISPDYVKFLTHESRKYGVEINFAGVADYSKIPEILSESSIFFTGTPKSADKAALEAAMSGCLILTTNESVQQLTGMSKVLPCGDIGSDFSKQLSWMLSLTEAEVALIRREVIKKSRELNSLENLVQKVTRIFDEFHA